MAKRLKITDWAEDDRPREKLMMKGASALSDAELLAILIGSGNREETAVELCRRILNDNHNNLNELARLSLSDLQKFKGIGEAKAISLMAALEIGKRRRTVEVIERAKINKSRDLFELFAPKLEDLIHEEFWAVFLNGANKVMEVVNLTKGGIRQTVVDVPTLLRLSLEKVAHAIAVAHNHPSGDIHPSSEDFTVTQKIKNGCDAIGVRFLDHIIVGESNYYSFADEGRI
ncbi:MAG: DNA repair protein RadC [Porphyromonadaceae bacterium]|nr:DNA repair protein RadC [Porphyromonadaceae bacterium]